MSTSTETMRDTRVGFVYVLSRADLGVCYVGQSIRSKRPAMHLKPGTYQFDALCGDGVEPLIEIVKSGFERGEDLDSAERDTMREMHAAGWQLVNKLGPDSWWPAVPFESCSAGGKTGGKFRGMKGTAVLAKTNPQLHKAISSKGARSAKARRAVDPEYAAAFEAVLQKGAQTRREKRASDPEWREREREAARRGGLNGGHNGGIATSRLRYVCVTCEMISTPGGIGYHQSVTGHTGRYVATLEKNSEEQ